MSRDKQIEEMAKHCHFQEEGKCLILEDEAEECDTKCDMCEFAKRLYNAGYRKSTDLAEEIFAEIEEMVITEKSNDGCAFYLDKVELAELKKKYTGGK